MDAFPGMPHGYWIFYPTYGGSAQARKKRIKGMAGLLDTDKLGA